MRRPPQEQRFLRSDIARAVELALPDFLDAAFPEPVALQQWQVEVLVGAILAKLAVSDGIEA